MYTSNDAPFRFQTYLGSVQVSSMFPLTLHTLKKYYVKGKAHKTRDMRPSILLVKSWDKIVFKAVLLS